MERANSPLSGRSSTKFAGRNEARATNYSYGQITNWSMRKKVGFGSMLSKKSFGGNKRNLLKLLMRFVRSDVGTTSCLRKTTTGLRIGTTEHRSGGIVQKSPFAKFLASFDFRLFRQHRSRATKLTLSRTRPFLPDRRHAKGHGFPLQWARSGHLTSRPWTGAQR